MHISHTFCFKTSENNIWRVALHTELQFSRILVGVYAKLLVDPAKMKLETKNSLTELCLARISEDLNLTEFA